MKINRFTLCIFVIALILYTNCFYNPKHGHHKDKDDQIKPDHSNGKNQGKDNESHNDNRVHHKKHQGKNGRRNRGGRKRRALKKAKKQCIKLTNDGDFCKFYFLGDRSYINQPDVLNQALKNFQENLKNPNITFLHEDHFDKPFNGQLNEILLFSPESCHIWMIKPDSNKHFCLNVVNSHRKYYSYSHVIKGYENFKKKIELYYPYVKQSMSTQKWDNYFDISTKFESASDEKFNLPLNILQCTWVFERFLTIYLQLDKSKYHSELKDFCELAISHHRDYSTVGKSVEALKTFIYPRRVKVLDQFFDVPDDQLERIKLFYPTVEKCLDDILEWDNDPDFRNFFCNSVLESQNKRGTVIMALELEGILKQAKKNYANVVVKTSSSLYFSYTLEQARALRNISFSTVENCKTELPFLIRLISYDKFRIDKLNIYCKNFVKQGRVYPNIDLLKEKLASFTENYELYHQTSLGNKRAAVLTVDDNQFFDYSNMEYKNMRLGYIHPKNVSTTECGFQVFDKKSVIKYYEKTALTINYYGGTSGAPQFWRKRSKALPLLTKLVPELEHKTDDKEKAYSYLEDIHELIEEVKELNTTDSDNLEEPNAGCPNSNKEALLMDEDILLDEFDLRKFGLVSDVEDQGQCGSCWAVSTAGMVEARLPFGNGDKSLERISRQYLLDCSGAGNCDGGNPVTALQYLMNHVFYRERHYFAYSKKKEECRKFPFQPAGKELKISNNEIIIHKSVDPHQLRFLLSGGPVVVHLDAKAPEFVFYSYGILKYDCLETNHSLLLVGWGYDRVLKKMYWILKNSWGIFWGMKGYVNIMMEKNWDACGMYSNVSEMR